MSFEDRLRNALDTAVSHYNKGCTPDEAVCKSACANGFNPDQTDRLVEVMNTAITLNQYKKAEDRTKSFPIAHKDKVASMMLDADTVLGKKAEVVKQAHVYFDYMTSAKKEPARASFEKVASAESGHDLSGVSDESLAELAMRQVTMRKNASAYAKDLEGSLHGQLVTDLYDLAESVRKFDTEKYAQFKSACAAKDIVDRLERVLPKKFSGVKEASGLIDDSVFSEELGKAECMHENYEFMKEMHKQAENLAKEAEDMKAELFEAFMDKEAAGGAAPGGTDKDKDKDKKKKKNNTQVNTNGLHEWIRIPERMFIGKRDPSSGGILTGMAKDVFSHMHGEEASDAAEIAENVKRSLILQELLAKDPVLADADPESVASSYNTLLHTAPSVASDKELVRAILRQTVQSTAISPFDAEQWAKLDQRIGGIPERSVV